jgi:hypothetical protein
MTVSTTPGVSYHCGSSNTRSPFVKIEVLRSDLLESSFRALMLVTLGDLARKPLRVRYLGEDGIDAGTWEKGGELLLAAGGCGGQAHGVTVLRGYRDYASRKTPRRSPFCSRPSAL